MKKRAGQILAAIGIIMLATACTVFFELLEVATTAIGAAISIVCELFQAACTICYVIELAVTGKPIADSTTKDGTKTIRIPRRRP